MTNINLDRIFFLKVAEARDLQEQGHVGLVSINAKTLTVLVDQDVYWSADDAMEPRHPTTADIA